MNDIDFEQELYKHFGQIKDFTLGMRIGQYFYELGKQSGSSEKPNAHEGLDEAAEGIVCTMINECSAVGIPNDHIPSWVQDAMIQSCKAGAEWALGQGVMVEGHVYTDKWGGKQIDTFPFKRDNFLKDFPDGCAIVVQIRKK